MPCGHSYYIEVSLDKQPFMEYIMTMEREQTDPLSLTFITLVTVAIAALLVVGVTFIATFTVLLLELQQLNM